MSLSDLTPIGSKVPDSSIRDWSLALLSETGPPGHIQDKRAIFRVKMGVEFNIQSTYGQMSHLCCISGFKNSFLSALWPELVFCCCLAKLRR